MSASRYGEPRHRAQLELRATAAQFVVEAELMVRWLDQLGGEPAPAHALEERHAQVLGRARSFEAALNHVVNLELLAAERPPDTPTPERPPATQPAERPPGSQVRPHSPSPRRAARSTSSAIPTSRSARPGASIPPPPPPPTATPKTSPPHARAGGVGLCMTLSSPVGLGP